MLAVETKSDATPAPAQRWRNYYRVYRVLHIGRDGHWFPGIHAGPAEFPSQAVAESYARGLLAHVNRPGRWIMEFAGAFREDGKAH